ncbi:hypothetical protein B0H11DRAFT_2276321 [Mycena galericulata]|nr:hypothetical protein B0H11DRAFT_2276321 [Mycena galericulata]
MPNFEQDATDNELEVSDTEPSIWIYSKAMDREPATPSTQAPLDTCRALGAGHDTRSLTTTASNPFLLLLLPLREPRQRKMHDARCTTPTHTHPTARRAHRHLLPPADALRSARARSPPSDHTIPIRRWRRCSDQYDFADMRAGVDDDARRAHGLAREGMTPRGGDLACEHDGWTSEGKCALGLAAGV